MLIRRHEKGAEWLDIVDWPILVDAPLLQAEACREPRWLGNYGDSEGPWAIWLETDGEPTEGSPAYRYLVELSEQDFGEILARMPVGAVSTILDRLLREGDPETIGAIVGRIVTHLARGGTGRSNPPSG